MAFPRSSRAKFGSVTWKQTAGKAVVLLVLGGALYGYKFGYRYYIDYTAKQAAHARYAAQGVDRAKVDQALAEHHGRLVKESMSGVSQFAQKFNQERYFQLLDEIVSPPPAKKK